MTYRRKNPGPSDRDALIEDPHGLIPAPKARRDLWGGISAMTEWRWKHRYEDFPEVTKIGERNYYKYAEAVDFNERRRAETPGGK